MWYQKRPNGSYRFFERYNSPLTGKTRTVSVTYSKYNRSVVKDAQLELNERINAKISEEREINTNLTLRSLADKFLKLYKQQVSYSTWYSADRGLTKICNDLGNETLAKKVTTTMLNRYLDNRLYDKESPLRNGGIQLVKKHISLMFKYGVKYGYLRSNPVDKVDITWRNEREHKADEIENKYLTDKEFSKILVDCHNQRRPDLEAMFTWLYLTGMRFSEAAAIQKKNIISKNGKWYARVNGSMVVLRDKDAVGPNNYVKSSSAKTSAGNRDVLLSEGALNIAQKHCIGKKDDDFLFINSINGLPMRETAVNRYLHRVQERQHISKKLTTHIFRHTHVSKLAEMGVPLFVIKRRLGHMNSKVTELVYLHITNREENQLEQKLNQLATILLPSKNK
ncbi:tyrosine-type recombinase/integrase [Limosilactobacillus vaginalis]|uniref:tyrosine-type recombinase/integrase n=1 Tax=Limosilactobacillus vaginalis TaxID=1633 RepID=UPI0022E469E8|nr:site-specific integrase [Limosilactobacillus vaginalis]